MTDLSPYWALGALESHARDLRDGWAGGAELDSNQEVMAVACEIMVRFFDTNEKAIVKILQKNAKKGRKK